MSKKTNHICADATYKLTIVGAPVLFVLITDKAKVFHLFGIAVTSSETAIHFPFIFDNVKKGCYTNDQFIYKSTALLADTVCFIHYQWIYCIVCLQLFRRLFDKKSFKYNNCFLYIYLKEFNYVE